MTKLNVAALAAIASAPPPPEPKVEGAVSTDTTISWPIVFSASDYVVRWRRTDGNQWQEQRLSTAFMQNRTIPMVCRHAIGGPVKNGQVEGGCKGQIVLKGIRVDDWVFGVSSVSKDGFESPVASAVPGGAFHPYIAPPKK